MLATLPDRRPRSQQFRAERASLRSALDHLGDWAVWVTLLFALERGSGVLGAEASRDLLLRRFNTGQGGTPRGFRVYAARVAGYVEPADPASVPYVLALHIHATGRCPQVSFGGSSVTEFRWPDPAEGFQGVGKP